MPRGIHWPCQPPPADTGRRLMTLDESLERPFLGLPTVAGTWLATFKLSGCWSVSYGGTHTTARTA